MSGLFLSFLKVLVFAFVCILISINAKADCIAAAEEAFELPENILKAILMVEGGRIGQEVINQNKTYDIGPMQVNSRWLPILSKLDISRQQLRDDFCINVAVGAWILANEFNRLSSSPKPHEIWEAVGRYNSRTPKHNIAYAQKVWRVMKHD